MDEYDWTAWREARPRPGVLHLDTAAVGRPSEATLAAVTEHARLEAEIGGYVAEDRAQGTLEELRGRLGTLMGTDADGVAFVESATTALEVLVAAWPLEPGATVGVAASEWGPNLEILEHLGLRTTALDVDGDGVLDLESLEARLRQDPPDVVLVDQVAAHRGLVQPAEEAVALARAHGVPVWVDAAQALGHVPVAGGDAVFAPSRKWLTGPRGVGVLAIAAPHRERLHVLRQTKHAGWPTVRHLDSGEAHVAGRVGLAVAVQEHLEVGPAVVARRLDEVGRLTREAVSSVTGWEVAHPGAPAGAITSVVATRGQDVVRAQVRLLEDHAVLTTACLPWRAPREMPASGPGSAPMLRLSPHVDLTDDDLERLCQALAEV